MQFHSVARRWPKVFLTDNHVTTFYGFQRLRRQATVTETQDGEASNKMVSLEWVLPDTKRIESKGFGSSLKAARVEASRNLLQQLSEPTEPEELIPIWRQVLETTRKQIKAEVYQDAPSADGHKIVWNLDNGGDLAVIGRGYGKVAELKALEALSEVAEKARETQAAPLKVKAATVGMGGIEGVRVIVS